MKSFKTLLVLLVTFGVATAFTDKPSATYTVDTEQSSVRWTGKKVTGQHNGVIDVQEGTLEVNGDQLNGGQFLIDMRSLRNEDLEGKEEDQAKLEGHLKSDDFFGVENHPTAELVITQVTPREGDQYTIMGDLTIKGTTHPIEFPATVNLQDGQLTAEADITVDRSKYDVRYGSDSFFDNLGDKVIYDDFEIAVSLVATSDASASK